MNVFNLFPSFSLETLSGLRSFKARKRYCDHHFKVVGRGSSRIVYDLKDGRVLKIAMNNKGILQNNAEADYGFHQFEIANGPLDHDENSYWLIAKKMEPVSRKELEAFVGMESEALVRFCGRLQQALMGMPVVCEVGDNEVLQKLETLCSDYDLGPGDLAVADNWGRDPETGQLKVIDLGLNAATREAYGMC